MIRAVIDTNVVVSGLLSPRGNAALILLAVHQGRLRPCLSRDILDEYAAVLARPKFAFPLEDIAAVIALLRRAGEVVDPDLAAATAASPDPSDTKFLQCALAAGADYLITGNKRHFPEGVYGATRIVSPAEVLDRVALDL